MVVLTVDGTLLVRDPGGDFHAAPAAGPPVVADAPTDTTPTDTVPTDTVPTETVPEETVPEETVPEETVPEETVPEETVPEETVPEETVPQETVPEETVPGSTTPEETTPVEPTPTDTTPTDTSTTPSGDPPPSADPLYPGESLVRADETPLLAPLEVDGHAGAYAVPTPGDDRVQDAVLRFDGAAWSREDICVQDGARCVRPGEDFRVAAIDAAPGGGAWLLATGTTPEAGLVLLRRDSTGAAPVWRPVSLGDSPFADRAPTTGSGPGVTVTPRQGGQPLVATARGVWLDASVQVGEAAPVDATLFYDASDERVAASWCDLTGAAAVLCTRPLGSALAVRGGRSFAWDDGSAFGRRVITGLDQGAILVLAGDGFARLPTAGRGTGGDRGAAFDATDDGWLGAAGGPVRYARTSQPGGVRTWPVPFRHPLTAIAAEPGVPVGAADSQALAVGDQGEVARYVPGQGWTPEPLNGPTGARVTPRLRGVAWPAADRAHAVGDNGEMWLWRRATGLWEPDPARPPNLATANFTAIAFEPGNPGRGYAVGKQGVLLRYDRQWTQEPLPVGLGDVNFSAITFAGHQAIAAYKRVEQDADGQLVYTGGLLVHDGSGWRRDAGLDDALPSADAELGPNLLPGDDRVPERVAGLPDGSAVVVTLDGHVAQRDGAAGVWTAVDADAHGYPTAVAAFHENGVLRSVLAVAVDDPGTAVGNLRATDDDTILEPAPAGQAPVLTDPYPIADTGYLLRRTASGWRDEQRAHHDPQPSDATPDFDLPERPDAVLALLVDPFGTVGWAVGGDVAVQTGGVFRYPDDGQAAPGAAESPVPTDAAQVTLAIGGGATCLGPCADLGSVGAGPSRWLPAAVRRAAGLPAVRAFVSTTGGTAGPAVAGEAFGHEQAAAAHRLTDGAGALPVYTAPSASDRDAGDSLDTWLSAYSVASVPLGAAPAAGVETVDAARSGHPYYSFASTAGGGGAGDAIRVVVLDTSRSELGEEQRCWLAAQLSDAALAATPAIVVGSRAVADGTDAQAVADLLVSGTAAGCPLPGPPAGASAYFFADPDANTQQLVASGADAIPAFGTASLGYVPVALGGELNKPGVSGFLLAQVDLAGRDPDTNRAPVTVRLIPNVAELAIDATDGTLLRRSQVALFDGLGRRPRSGQGCRGGAGCVPSPDPYTAIPFRCLGEGCEQTLVPEYSFTSSDPSVADFVARDPTSTNPRRVLLDDEGNPSPDAASGLLCAFNAGTTTVTLQTGGLSYSTAVTVQAGSVRRPCGTVPAARAIAGRAASQSATIDPLLPQPAPVADTPAGQTPLTPPPVPAAAPPQQPAPVAKTPPAKPPKPAQPLRPPLLDVFTPVPPPVLRPPIAPPPPPSPPPPPPAPPSGSAPANASSPVGQMAASPERQREEEHALDAAHSMARYDAGLGRYATGGGVALLLVLAAFALTELRPRPRPRPAFSTTDDRRPPRTPR